MAKYALYLVSLSKLKWLTQYQTDVCNLVNFFNHCFYIFQNNEEGENKGPSIFNKYVSKENESILDLGCLYYMGIP